MDIEKRNTVGKREDIMSIKVSFITINYNSSEYTLALVTSIKKYTSLGHEIIIVDNNSKSDDYEKLVEGLGTSEGVNLIKNELNEGFAAGNMLGQEYASGEYLFFINNDTELLNDTTIFMANYLDIHKDIGLATAKVKDENGNFSSSYKLFPSLIKELFGNSVARKFTKYNFPSNKLKLSKPTLVEVVSGSCMFFRSRSFQAIGGFDKEFFLYCEEEDISKRIWLAGEKVVFLPSAEIRHYSGGSSEKSFEMEREYYISYHLLVKKHFSFISQIILRTLLLFKLFRRGFNRKNGWKLFSCALKNCKKEYSLRYIQIK